MPSSDKSEPRIGRRTVIAGGGLALGAALAAPPAEAAPRLTAAKLGGPPAPPASSVESTIASPRRTGVVYRTVFMFDFSCENPDAKRRFGGSGVYVDGPPSALWASVDIPAGAQVYDVEWYARNTSGDDASAIAFLWDASFAGLSTQVAFTTIDGGQSFLSARRSLASEDENGPYPTGTKLALGFFTGLLGDAIQLNGARVGLIGGGEVSTLSAPVVVYDTRQTGGRFAINETRTIFLSPRLCKPGSVAVTLNISAFSGSAPGFLRIYPQEAPLPSGRSFTFPATDAVNAQITVPVSPSRRLRIRSTQTVHIIVEVVGSVG